MPQTSTMTRLTLSLSLACLLTGCTGTSSTRVDERRPTRVQPVVLDGEIREWPPSVVAATDPWFLYLRWKVAGASMTLQSSDESFALWLDTDTNPATGWRPDSPSAAGQLGIDLEIEFSPPRSDGSGPGQGVRTTIHGPTGGTVSHADVGFSFSPTYASEWYEGRVSRQFATDLGLPSTGLGSDGLVSGIFVLRDGVGSPVGWSQPFEVEAVPASAAPPRADLALPGKPAQGLRVVSWNVLRGKPMEDPGPFARVLRVLDPDIILLQEWTTRPHDIASWLNASVPLPEGEWEVRTSYARGVAVASRFPLEPLGHEELMLDGADNPVRFVGAIADTPMGLVAASSVHLKCCGGSQSPEDQTRISEAGAINRSLSEALSVEPVSFRLIAGDLNLVGSRPPIDVLRNGLDTDGTNLEIVDARVLGDNAYTTWREDDNVFSPGRLDYALVGDADARLVRSFVLDARVLSDSALERAGLDRTDTDASDHLPLVFDIVPR